MLRGGRGASGWFGADYERTLTRFPIPVIGHEVGQWCAYPDFDVIKKFSGPATTFAGAEPVKVPYMIPGNYEIMRDSAEAHGLLAKNKDFAHASGRFQVACYKEEIEASLRTPSYSGFEILDLHDYLGQGGALIGMLDAFWESKGYATAAEFRQWNNTTVPLARFKDRVYTTADTFTADVEVAHFGPAPLANATSHWSIVGAWGQGCCEWELGGARDSAWQRNGSRKRIRGPVEASAPAQYKLVVQLQSGTTISRTIGTSGCIQRRSTLRCPPSVLITSSWPEAEARLATGGKVLFLPKGGDLDSSDPKVSTLPIFWNHLMNPNGTTMLGFWNDTKHPALGGLSDRIQLRLAVGGHYGQHPRTQYRYAAQGSAADCPAHRRLEPQPQLALLYECSVGTGKLMVCGIDLDAARAGTPSLRRSILDYMASERFKPAVPVTVADLRAHWFSLDPNHVDPGANKPPARRRRTLWTRGRFSASRASASTTQNGPGICRGHCCGRIVRLN